MKRLMIAAAAAAMTAGAFAAACVDEGEVAKCYAWDVKMTLKTLGPKKLACTYTSDCTDTTGLVYYMDDVTRKLKGYFWLCEYSCDSLNVVLWDAKNKKAVVAYADEPQTADASALVVYGKKATKVAGSIEIAGVDASGNDGLEATAAGVKGKMQRGVADDDCYVKSLSGYVAGKIAYIRPGTITRTVTTSLCEEVVEEEDCSTLAQLIPFCDACCFTSWCEADNEWDDLVPAVGTWSMKYNKAVSAGKKGTIRALVPAFAL